MGARVDLEVVYVTVGTTKFEPLVEEITSEPVLNILKARGCRKLIIQSGTGLPVETNTICARYGIEVEQYGFKFEPLRLDIQSASLVIGHAGAGTCMDILNARKPGLIVVNADLMDNHQLELAKQLAEEQYIYYCDVPHLLESLQQLDMGKLRSYERCVATNNLDKFVQCLNGMMSRFRKKC